MEFSQRFHGNIRVGFVEFFDDSPKQFRFGVAVNSVAEFDCGSGDFLALALLDPAVHRQQAMLVVCHNSNAAIRLQIPVYSMLVHKPHNLAALEMIPLMTGMKGLALVVRWKRLVVAM